MKKSILKMALIGAPIGVFVTTAIVIFISLGIGDGFFYPVVPQMAQCYGNELNAVVIQTLCSALMGASIGAANIVWKSDRLGLLMQTIIHFVIICGVYVAVAYACFWMEHSAWAVAGYVMTFAIIYAIIWIVLFVRIKLKLKKLNEKVAQG